MKNCSILFSFAAFIILTVTEASSQTIWTKHASNPVMGVGTPGSWDDVAVYPNRVIAQDSVHKMWYTGYDGTVWRIGYATSTDSGITWQKHPANPVLAKTQAWESNNVWLPYVIFADSRYRMWYASSNSMGYASSPDGIVWTKYSGNPVLNPDPSAWDAKKVGWASVLGPDASGRYKMWYEGWDASNDKVSVGYAMGSDTVTWTKYSGNPLLSPGSSGSWDDRRVHCPRVIYNGQRYELWYPGTRNNVFVSGQTGYAVGTDTISWTKRSANPVLPLGSASSWESQGVYVGDVLFDGTTYRMWYTGYDGTNFRVGYATAPVDPPSSVKDLLTEIPARYLLHQNYPNPFNPSTEIQFSLPHKSHVTLTIFDLLGREVTTLVSEELSAGSYSTRWDAKGIPSGVYLYRVRARQTDSGEPREFVETKKLLLLR